MTPIKLPVSYANGRIDDADGVSILAVVQSTVINHIPRWRSRQEQDEIGEAAARALNAAPDLDALREAVEAARRTYGQSQRVINHAYMDIVDVAFKLFPKDPTP